MLTIPPNRRQIFIKKAFQRRFIVSVLLLIMASGLVSGLLTYWLAGNDLHAQMQTAHASIALAEQRLSLALLMGTLSAVFITGVATVYIVLYASHKIAGPLYRFEKICEQIGNDELDIVISLREHDQLHELAQAFAIMLDKLSYRKRLQKERIAQLTQLLSELQRDEQLQTQQAALLNEITQTLKQLQ